MAYFTELEQVRLKFLWNHRKIPNSQYDIEKEEPEVTHALISNYTTKL